jgi:hypothetical protein
MTPPKYLLLDLLLELRVNSAGNAYCSLLLFVRDNHPDLTIRLWIKATVDVRVPAEARSN